MLQPTVVCWSEFSASTATLQSVTEVGPKISGNVMAYRPSHTAHRRERGRQLDSTKTSYPTSLSLWLCTG